MSATAFMINGFDPAAASRLGPEEQRLIARRRALLGPSYKLFYEHPVQFVRAEGVRLYDPQGNAYLDAYNNVPAVGHCHPKVVAAIAEQAARLNTHTRYLDEAILAYAEALLATYPPEIGNVMFTCTGSEATDLALRVARFHTGGSGIVVTRNAYHGITSAAAAISPSMGPNVPLGEHVLTIAAPNPYREAGDVAQRFAEDVRAAAAWFARHGIRFAGLVVDTIFSTDGILPDPAGALAPALAAVHEAGGLFIADEVQPGFGRLGSAMWGFQRHGIVPDIVVMGKPMGNGMPIAGIAARPELLDEFGTKVRYFNTFGANSVSIAAARAVLEVIADEGLMANAAEVGAHLMAGLRAIARTTPSLGDVRGAGLFVGAEFVDPRTGAPDGRRALAVVNRLRERRILISASGAEGSVLKIRPPLPFSQADADEFLVILAEVVAGLDRENRPKDDASPR
ncbi:aspartate aminotransferase family protein [Labrys wisconsinensis]|uniref:4-aminobutyrate aminotransferase-like enzyme n=1 Tax=Labrys wisconsinensis TaxID=425677 RepID=A0ABU0JIE9_9HYPH|nr:4-aminobutyrate aminotransferase-like enzyme [Labrys wisconsinensis]